MNDFVYLVVPRVGVTRAHLTAAIETDFSTLVESREGNVILKFVDEFAVPGDFSEVSRKTVGEAITETNREIWRER